MFLLLCSDPKSSQIVDLSDIKSENQVGIDLGPVLEVGNRDVAGSIRVRIGVLNNAALDHVLLMSDQVDVLRASLFLFYVVLIEVIVFNGLLHPVDNVLHGHLFLHTVLGRELYCFYRLGVIFLSLGLGVENVDCTVFVND